MDGRPFRPTGGSGSYPAPSMPTSTARCRKPKSAGSRRFSSATCCKAPVRLLDLTIYKDNAIIMGLSPARCSPWGAPRASTTDPEARVMKMPVAVFYQPTTWNWPPMGPRGSSCGWQSPGRGPMQASPCRRASAFCR